VAVGLEDGLDRPDDAESADDAEGADDADGADRGDVGGDALAPPEGSAPRRRTGVLIGAALAVVVIVAGLAAVAMWRADGRLSVGGGAGEAAGPPGQVGVPWERGLLALDGLTVAVRFEGVPRSGDEPCGAHYLGLSSALAGALRVTVITIPGPGPSDGSTCPDEHAVRCTEVRLPYPPGDQQILDAMTGLAPPLEQVPTTLGPASAGSGGSAPASGSATASAPGDLCAELTAG
jgi:hypothetical protein